MEVLQTILMVIGAVTFIWLLVKLAKGCFWLLGGLLEAGFRNRFPDDFMMHFGWIISEMETRGYVQSDMMDAGGEYPGILMKNEETGGEMEIRLRAPFFQIRDIASLFPTTLIILLLLCKTRHQMTIKDY